MEIMDITPGGRCVSLVRTVGMAFAVTFALLLAPMALADTADKGSLNPHDIVAQTTEALFDVVREYKGKTDTEDFYRAVTEVLEPVVHFGWIARTVMGDHAEGASPEQLEAFGRTFKEGLVKSYARGIEGYVDSQIRVLPPEQELGDSRRVVVHQEVRDSGKTYRLSYNMGRNREGQWQLLNVMLDGVNLGRTFRSQFAQAMRQHDGDLDAVIANWLSED